MKRRTAVILVSLNRRFAQELRFGVSYAFSNTALNKDFPIKSEKRTITFRWEAYNAFNHTQYASVNTAARFDPTGAQTNALFGTVISTRAARVMQGSLRFTF
jgi:hypothetical protein